MTGHPTLPADNRGQFARSSSADAGPPPPTPRWQVPPLQDNDRALGGVAAGLALELGVDVMAVRAALILAALSGGWGLVIYGAAWVLMSRSPLVGRDYIPQPKAASVGRRYLALFAIVTGITLLLRALGFWFIDWIVLPAGFVILGALIAWSRGQQGDGGIPVSLRVLAGVVVASAGMIAMAVINFPTTQTLQVLAITAAILAGLALIVGPSLLRIGSALDDERQQRVRADERALVAAHLHDSVLQTLMLIQKHAEDPARTARIARQQERDLRSWLYDPKAQLPGTQRLGPALEAAASRVEQHHSVRIEVVTVGDSEDIDPDVVESVTSAASEAMTNAAKHSGRDTIDVYAERTAKSIEVFIRDDGVGFNLDDVATDRMGIRESIRGRLERLGGSVRIESEPGAGTEVELTLPYTPTDSHDAEPSIEHSEVAGASGELENTR